MASCAPPSAFRVSNVATVFVSIGLWAVEENTVIDTGTPPGRMPDCRDTCGSFPADDSIGSLLNSSSALFMKPSICGGEHAPG